jgi:hypothetical protein
MLQETNQSSYQGKLFPGDLVSTITDTDTFLTGSQAFRREILTHSVRALSFLLAMLLGVGLRSELHMHELRSCSGSSVTQ